MPRPALLAAAALSAALATPAAPEGLAPGFWIFPATPGHAEAELVELCTMGMTLVQLDGSNLSLFVQDGRLIVDGEAVCTRDGPVETCAGHDYQPGRDLLAFGSRQRYERDTDGHLTLRYTSGTDLGREGFVSDRISYPQMCPPAAVRNLLVGWLAP